MAGIKGFRPFTEKEFEQMKLLQAQGKNTMELATIFNRSSSTTSFVSRSNTFQEYHDLVHRTVKKQPSQQWKKYIATPVSSDARLEIKIDKILKVLEEHTEQLKLIPKRRKF